ncbi:MAG: hypothetical protein ACTSSH_00840, partial [Candidatus Heimdallarchaeota archaeon]
MSNVKTKPYLKVIIISIVFISAMSIGIFVVMSSWLHDSATRYSETSEILDSFGDLAEADIQIILQEDAAKYETAYSCLTEIYFLNNQYEAMVEYNV